MNPIPNLGRGLVAAALLSSFLLTSSAAIFPLSKAVLDYNGGRIDFGLPTIPTGPNTSIPNTLDKGDTIEIEPHTRTMIVLSRIVKGSETEPITITNAPGGQFIIDTTDTAYLKGFTLSGCSHFILKGTDVPDAPPATTFKPGIVIAHTPAGVSGVIVTQHGGPSTPYPLTGATDFEVTKIDIGHTGFAGVFIKCDSIFGSTGISMDNVRIHHLTVHDTGGEGMYIGASDFNTQDRQEIHGIEIHHNTVTNTGWDGIQLGCATQNATIHDNTIIGYGVLAGTNDKQDEGIRSNTGTAADIYNNVIIGDPANSGTGIFADPYNSVKFYNNVIVTPEERGIYILDAAETKAYTPDYMVTLANNTIINPGTFGIEFANPAHSKANRFINNIIVVPSPDTRAKSILDALVGMEVGNLYRATTAEIGFVNAAGGDYDLAAGSLAIDTGYNAASNGVTVDIDGIARPQGAAFDVGAYEYVAAAGNAPVITTQPGNQTATMGSGATFSVVASGSAPLAYQWRKNGTTISGATGASYTITAVQTSDAGGYSVVVSNAYGAVTSNTATLTVATATGLITPAGYGQAGSAFCPATGTFNEQPAWNAGSGVPTGVSASPYTATGTAYPNRYWYIDFGPNWANLRITGTWTRYMPQTTASYPGFGTMWWDDDNDAVNDGIAATGLNFGTAQNLNTGSGQPWVRDTNATAAPIAPQGHYLIINTGSAPAARANEFAISGYTVY